MMTPKEKLENNLTPDLGTNFGELTFRNVWQSRASENGVVIPCYEGRFNRGFESLYLSCDLYACTAEIIYYGSKKLHVGENLPRTFVSIKLSLTNVLDLTNTTTLSKIGITKDRLTEEWDNQREPETQILGIVAKAKGYEAILTPSARYFNGKNLALIKDNVLTKLEVVNADKLQSNI
jgi:hypothetical protein